MIAVLAVALVVAPAAATPSCTRHCRRSLCNRCKAGCPESICCTSRDTLELLAHSVAVSVGEAAVVAG